MNTKYPIAAIAELIGEPARAAILLALMDGRSLTAGELALIANVSAQSTSAHLSKMVAGGLLKAQSSGRHRYYRLAGSDVAHAIEALATIATLPPSSAAIPTRNALEIRTARSCYEHLAGRIAVEIATALEEEEVIRHAANETTNSVAMATIGFRNWESTSNHFAERAANSRAAAWIGPNVNRT